MTPPQTSLNPVVLVHGIWDTAAKFNRLATHLEKAGWQVHRFSLQPNTGEARLEVLANQLVAYIEGNLSSTQAFDLVGYSMGGLITRYYLQRLGGIQRVHRYVSIAAPNQGTWSAWLLPFLKGVAQMRPGSPFIQSLDQDAIETLSQVQTTVLWTPFDVFITPPRSSILPVGEQQRIKIGWHADMVEDLRALSAITAALSQPYRQSPLPNDPQTPPRHERNV